MLKSSNLPPSSNNPNNFLPISNAQKETVPPSNNSSLFKRNIDLSKNNKPSKNAVNTENIDEYPPLVSRSIKITPVQSPIIKAKESLTSIIEKNITVKGPINRGLNIPYPIQDIYDAAKEWLGDNFTAQPYSDRQVFINGKKTWLETSKYTSADGQRTFRPPFFKGTHQCYQANFELKAAGQIVATNLHIKTSFPNENNSKQPPEGFDWAALDL